MSSDLKQPKERRELCSVLLDSYTLHQGHRISASQTIVSQDLCASLCMCLAFSSPEDYCTTIAIAKYSVEDPRTELQAEVGIAGMGCCTNTFVLCSCIV